MSTRTYPIIFLSAFASLVCCSALLVALTLGELPSRKAIREGLRKTSNQSASEVLDRRGRVIATIGGRRQYPVPLNSIPKHVIASFVATEDERFYSHFGIDPVAVFRAALANIRGLRIDQGASTITQQLVRMTFLNRDKTWRRKIREAVLSLYVEMTYSKDQILNFYLNRVYLGNHAYGIESAARHYFRKHVGQLTLGEGALLAGLPQAPSAYAPNRYLDRALKRRRTVLRRLANSGYLSEKEYLQWRSNIPFIAPGPSPINIKAPYFVDFVTREVRQRLGYLPSGIKIFTTLDSELQISGATAVAEAARASDLSRFSLEAKANQRVPGSSRLKLPRNARSNGEVEGALVTLDVKTGAILAMQGGRLHSRSQFNRSVLLRRPVGELVAPLLATLALDKGFQPEDDLSEGRWEVGMPGRGSGSRYGKQPTVKDALKAIIQPEELPFRRRFGYQTLVAHLRGFALETSRHEFVKPLSGVRASPLQLASAYQSIFNQGRQVEPYSIVQIVNSERQVLFQSLLNSTGRSASNIPMVSPDGKVTGLNRRMSRTAAKIATKMITSDTKVSGLVVATSDGNRNSWFVGHSEDQVTAFWLGAERGRTTVAASSEATKLAMRKAWRDFIRRGTNSLAKPSRGDGNAARAASSNSSSKLIY